MKNFINENEKRILSEALLKASIDRKKFDDIHKFINFLIKKNSELNLISRKTGITEIINDHIFDCLAGFKYFEKSEVIYDLGTGGGFPGILLAIVFNDKNINLVEKSIKKVMYIKEAKDFLGLNNIKIIEGLAENENIAGDTITCRAFKTIIEIIDMTRKYFNNNGKYILYKARLEKIDEELKEASKKYDFKYEIIKIKEILEKERHMVLLNKN